MSQGMGHYVRTESGLRTRRPERPRDPGNRLPVPLDNALGDQAQPDPAAEVCKQAGRQLHRGLTLFRLQLSRSPAVENTAFEVNPSPPRPWAQGGTANCPRPCAGIEGHQNKSSEVLGRRSLGNLAALLLSEA